MGWPMKPYGISYWRVGRLGSGGCGARLLRPAWPWVINATSHQPALMAAMAWAMWMMNDEPPTVVLSVKRGLMPR